MNAVVLVTMCLLIFIWILKLQFLSWPSFMGN